MFKTFVAKNASFFRQLDCFPEPEDEFKSPPKITGGLLRLGAIAAWLAYIVIAAIEYTRLPAEVITTTVASSDDYTAATLAVTFDGGDKYETQLAYTYLKGAFSKPCFNAGPQTPGTKTPACPPAPVPYQCNGGTINATATLPQGLAVAYSIKLPANLSPSPAPKTDGPHLTVSADGCSGTGTTPPPIYEGQCFAVIPSGSTVTFSVRFITCYSDGSGTGASSYGQVEVYADTSCYNYLGTTYLDEASTCTPEPVIESLTVGYTLSCTGASNTNGGSSGNYNEFYYSSGSGYDGSGPGNGPSATTASNSRTPRFTVNTTDNTASTTLYLARDILGSSEALQQFGSTDYRCQLPVTVVHLSLERQDYGKKVFNFISVQTNKLCFPVVTNKPDYGYSSVGTLTNGKTDNGLYGCFPSPTPAPKGGNVPGISVGPLDLSKEFSGPATWTVGGTELNSNFAQNFYPWSGIGLIVFQTTEYTVTKTQTAGRSVFGTLGSISGAYGGLMAVAGAVYKIRYHPAVVKKLSAWRQKGSNDGAAKLSRSTSAVSVTNPLKSQAGDGSTPGPSPPGLLQ